ncbi:GHMP kinase [bacterium]|nr:GHMP kinase [bacterium]
MILVKTPLRISFFGGSSDIPSFYNNSEGMCISTTINKYMYITACKTSLDGVKAVYNEIELVKNIDDLKHDRIKNALKLFGVSKNIEIASFSEIPTKGTGLGSSSAFTVGLVDALVHLTNNTTYNRFDVAETACDIEINMCGDPIGKQDQYAAAFGGFNLYRFNKTGVDVEPMGVRGETIKKLNDNLFLFYTGVTRNAADILDKQAKTNNTSSVFEIVEIAKQGYICIRDNNLNDFGKLLDYSWQLKRGLASGISNNRFDEMYYDIINSGAIGGKILGAGGGGYFLFYVPEAAQTRVIERASMWGLQKFDFKFSNEGSRVEYANR